MSEYDFIAHPEKPNQVWQPSMQDIMALVTGPTQVLANRIAVENALAQRNIDIGKMNAFLTPQQKQLPPAQQQQAYGQQQGQMAQQAAKAEQETKAADLVLKLKQAFGTKVLKENWSEVQSLDPHFAHIKPEDITDDGIMVNDPTTGKPVGMFVTDPAGKARFVKIGSDTKTAFEALETSMPKLPGESEAQHQQRIYTKYQKDQAALTGAKATATAHAYDQQVQEIGDAMIAGKQPPEISGFGMAKIAAPLKAYLAEKGFDLTTANLDYIAQKKYMATLNGAQQVRLRQATDFAYSSLDKVEELAKLWQGGNYAPLNKVNLIAAKNGAYGPEAASIATRLDTQIADLTSELGTVYKGGNSSTDESLKLAAKNLQSDWSEKVILDVVPLIRYNLDIRKNSQKFAGAATSQNPREPEPSDKKKEKKIDPKDVISIKGPSNWVEIVDGKRVEYKGIPQDKAARFYELHPNAMKAE